MDRQSALRNAVLQRQMFANGGEVTPVWSYEGVTPTNLNELLLLEEEQKRKEEEERDRELRKSSVSGLAYWIKKNLTGGMPLSKFIRKGLPQQTPRSGILGALTYSKLRKKEEERRRKLGESYVFQPVSNDVELGEGKYRLGDRRKELDKLKIPSSTISDNKVEELLKKAKEDAAFEEDMSGPDPSDIRVPTLSDVTKSDRVLVDVADGQADDDSPPNFFVKIPPAPKEPEQVDVEALLKRIKNEGPSAIKDVQEDLGIVAPSPEEPQEEESFFDILSDKVDLFSAGLEIAQRGAVGQYPSGSGLTGIISDVSAGLKVGRKERLRQEKELKLWEEKEKDRKQQMEIAIREQTGAHNRAMMTALTRAIGDKNRDSMNRFIAQTQSREAAIRQNAQMRADNYARARREALQARRDLKTKEFRIKQLDLKETEVKARERILERDVQRKFRDSYLRKRSDILEGYPKFIPEKVMRDLLNHEWLYKTSNLQEMKHKGKGILKGNNVKRLLGIALNTQIAGTEEKGKARRKKKVEILEAWEKGFNQGFIPKQLFHEFTDFRNSNLSLGNPFSANNKHVFSTAIKDFINKIKKVN